MENIRNLILEKIKSCMSCNEDQCRFMKERMERHVLSHHSSSGQTVSSQTPKPGRISRTLLSSSDNEVLTLSEQTSTSDPKVEELNKGAKQTIDEIEELDKGAKQTIDEIEELDKGAKQTIDDIEELNKGAKQTTDEIEELNKGSKQTIDEIEELDKGTKQTVYREGLKEVINKWAKELPKYSNLTNEYLKQNIIHEFIEKLGNLSEAREANERYYDLRLAKEIDKLLDSLPTIPGEFESDLVNLKENLLERISDLNKKILNEGIYETDKKQRSESLTEIRSSSSTQQNFNKNNLFFLETQKVQTSTPNSSLSDNSESRTDLNVNYNGKKLVDAQVQQSFSAVEPFYGNMFRKPNSKIDKQQNKKIIENTYKQIISNWLDHLTRKLDQNEKGIIADAIMNRLLPLLNEKYTINNKILLKSEVLNCLNDYMIILISPENYSQRNRISDDLAVKLLDAKFNQEDVNSMLSESYFPNSKDKMLPMNFKPENYLDIVVQNIVSDKLGDLNISNRIKRDIINIILQNIKLIYLRQDHYIETLILDIFQHYTELSDYYISNIVKSILDEIRTVATNNYLHMYNTLSYYDNYKLYRPSLISVYKSEHEIPKVSFLKNDELKKQFSLLTEDEKRYIDNISKLIKTWMTTLPNSITKVSKKAKEVIIKNLAKDILDQVKLEQIVPETKVEKDKYLLFFIHRMLNRLNCFENISDAQPYAEKLLQEIKTIPVPTISKKQNLDDAKKILTSLLPNSRIKSLENKERIENESQTNGKNQNIDNSIKYEVILKDFIAKYIEHNNDEDSALTREVFGNILKMELKKLSTPTRNKVYHDLSNQIDQNLTSKKIAKELQYINIISDWFQLLPFESSFNVAGNQQRAQYVNDLAQIIYVLEENRLTDTDYDKQLKSTLTQFIDNLPITKKYSHDMSFLIDDVIAKIASLRYSEGGAFEKDLSLNVSAIPDQNLSDFIEGYIRENSDGISDDELKLDAWALRLLGEIDIMACENPSALSTFKVYNRLADISSQGDDIGKRFNMELSYAKEISDWLNNLPLQRIEDKSAKDLRIQMISDLAEKMSLRWHIKSKEPNNTRVDADLIDYIEKWIKDLPLDHDKELNLTLLMQQLSNRMDRANTEKQIPPLIQPNSQNYINNIWKSPQTFYDNHDSREQNTRKKESMRNKYSNKGILGTSQDAGPSSAGMPWLSPPPYPLPENVQQAPKRPSDLILDIVETWCQQLPLVENTQQDKDKAQLLKDNLVVKIIMKISELNGNPETFENGILYDFILDDELENLMSTLPSSNELIQNKTVLKKQLIDAINAIKPLIMEEKARYEYKQELKNTVDQVLGQPPNLPPEKVALFITLRDEIVDNFVAYSFCKDYEEGQEVHKTMVRNAVKKYYVGKISTNIDENADPVIKGNQLLRELAKVPVPSAGVLIEEIHEIRMKFQITELFEELSLTDDANKLALKNQVKSTLARRLSDFNKTSFIQNRPKVREDIMKNLHKIQNEIDPQKVENFIKQLENSENRRISQLSQDDKNNIPKYYKIGENNNYKTGENFTSNENPEDEQWMSLLPATPKVHDPNYHDTIEFRENRKSLGEEGSPQAPGYAFDLSISPSGIGYNEFKGGEPLTSSVINKPQPIQSLSNSRVKSRAVVPAQNQRSSVGPSNDIISQGYQPIDNNANRYLESSPRSGNLINKPQPIQSLSSYSGKSSAVVPEQNQRSPDGPSTDVISQGYQPIDNNANRYLEPGPRSGNLINKPQPIQRLPSSSDKSKAVVPHQFQRSPVGPSTDVISQGYQPIDNNANRYLEPSPRSGNLINIPQPIQRLPSSSDKSKAIVPHQFQRIPVGPSNNVISQGYQPIDNKANRYLEPSPRSGNLINKPQPIQRLPSSSDKSKAVVPHQFQRSPVGPSTDVISQGYQPIDNNANRYLEPSPRSGNLINKPQPIQRLPSSSDKPRAVVPHQFQRSPVGPSNNVISQGYRPIDNNANRYLDSSPRNGNLINKPQPIQRLPSSSDQSRAVVPDQNQRSPVGPRNDVISQGYQTIDNNANRYFESSPRNGNLINKPQPTQSLSNYSDNSSAIIPDQNQRSPVGPRNGVISQGYRPIDNNANRYLESSPRTGNLINNPQPTQSLSSYSDNSRAIIPDQNQRSPVGPSNGVISQGYRPIDNNANRYLESSPRKGNLINRPQPIQRLPSSSDKSRAVVLDQNQRSPVGPRNDVISQGYQTIDNNANRYLESSPRNGNLINKPQPTQSLSNYSDNSSAIIPDQNQRSPVGPSNGVISQGYRPIDNNANRYLESSPRNGNLINKPQPTQSLSSYRDNSRAIIPDQNQRSPVGPSNGVSSQGYRPIDNNANRYLESSPRDRNKNLESQNTQTKLSQKKDARPDFTINSPQSQNSDSRSLERIWSQIRTSLYQNFYKPPQSEHSGQTGSMAPHLQNQMSPSAKTHQSNQMLSVQSPDLPSQQNQYGTPTSFQQTSDPQNIPGPRLALPQQKMPQLSRQTPCNSKCNKGCRRPSIMLLKPPKTQSNQGMQGTIRPISDDEVRKCLCTNKIKKQCRGSPVCPAHMRRQCKLCNEVKPFSCVPPYRRYCRY